MSLLEVKNLSKSFGGLAAVSNISLRIEPGELIGIIGPNGAGKTTFFNLLTGVYVPDEGDVLLNNHSIIGKKPHVITGMGMARTFQNIRLFKHMSVIDNIKVAMNIRRKYGLCSALLRLPRFYKEEERLHTEALSLLATLGLADKHDLLAMNLPYGEQRKLEIARALACNPTLLFLDEPAAGMNPQETKELTELICKIKELYNITIVLIEHDMGLVMRICERIFVLEYGKLIASGTPENIKNNKRVIEAYLGEG